MVKLGFLPRFIVVLRQFHDGMQACVQNGWVYTKLFPVTNGGYNVLLLWQAIQQKGVASKIEASDRCARKASPWG